MRRNRILSLMLAAALAVTVAPAAAGSPGDWPQQGGDAGHTSRVTSPGNLSPTTVRSLGLQLSAPTRIDGGFAVADGVAYATTSSGRLVATSTVNGRALWSQATCDGAPQGTNPYADTAPAVSGSTVWVSSGRYLTGISLATHFQVACVALAGGTAGGTGTGSPTVYGGSVYVANGNRVLAVDAATGSVRWSVRIPAGQVASTLAVDGGLVVVPAVGRSYRGGWVYALRTLDGRTQWTYHRSAPATAVAVSGGRVYVGNVPAALDEPTGQLLWTNTGYHATDTGLTVADGRVYVFGGENCYGPRQLNCDGDVFAFDVRDGHLLWLTSISSEGAGVVSEGGGVVYVTDAVDSGRVFLLNAATGAVISSFAHPGGIYDSQPVVVQGRIHVLSFLLGLLQAGGSGAFLDRWGA